MTSLADEYVNAYFEANPRAATLYDVSSPRHDDLWGDNSLEALARWRAVEDRLLAQVVAVDPDSLVGRPEWVTYGILREQLEAGVARRVCREELWYTRSVADELGLSELFRIFAAQPVDSPEAKEKTLARSKDLARYLDVEISKLQQGLAAGYLGEKNNVRRVIGQMDALLDGPIEATPLFDPALRAKDAGFGRKLAGVIADDVRPAIGRYRGFLETTYLPRAREQPSVAATPGGAACYRAFLREGTSTAIEPEEIHRLGLEQMKAIEDEMRAIARRSFQAQDLGPLLQKLRGEQAYRFASADEVLRCARESVARAGQAVPRVFGRLPTTEIEVRAADGAGTGGGVYQSSPSPGRPGIYWLSLAAPEKEPRLKCEAVAFHEGIPGHHLQESIGHERGAALHPLAKYFWNNGFGEGWALYGERLADELGLYSDDLQRMGMLSMQAFRAARLVVDTGLHSKDWSRDRAIEYMLAHTAESRKATEEEVDRYIGWPGQATGYMVGMLEIRRLRDGAQARMGTRFDLKQFHDRVLEDGQVPLPMLRAKIERWAAARP